MSKFKTRMSVFSAALATALIAIPVTAPVAVADPPSWAPAHGYRQGHGNNYGKYKYRRQVRRDWRDREVRRTVYVSRPVYVSRTVHNHSSHRHVNRTELGVSPSLGGAIIGGLLGGLGGSQIGSGSGRTAAIVGGIAAGAVIGGSIGGSMEAGDQARVQNTLERGRTGETVIWNNADTGNRYEMTPTRTYRTADRRNCREYTSWVFLGGYEEQVTGTACRMPDGSWQRQSG